MGCEPTFPPPGDNSWDRSDLSPAIRSGWAQSCSRLSSSFSPSLSSSPCQERKSWSTPLRMLPGWVTAQQITTNQREREKFNFPRRNDSTNCSTPQTLLPCFGGPGTARGAKMFSSVNCFPHQFAHTLSDIGRPVCFKTIIVRLGVDRWGCQEE